MSRHLKRVIAIALIAIQVLTSNGASVFAQDFGKQFTGTLLLMKEQGDNQSNNALSEKAEVEENGLAELAQANEEEDEKEKLGEGENVNDEKLNEDEPGENEEKKEEPQEEPEVEKVSETEDEEEETAKESIEEESEEETSEEETSEKEISEKETTEEETSEEETTAEESKENIASASDALFGDGENTFTLTYNFNDKSHDGIGSTDVDMDVYADVQTKVVTNGEEYGFFAHVARDGYDFLGWSFERDGEVLEYGDIVDLTEDKTIYAVWEVRKYKFRITQNLFQNGVVTDGKSYIEFTFDENIMDTIKNNGLEAPTKDTWPEVYDCLEYEGWNFNGDVDAGIIKDTDTFTNPYLTIENDPCLVAKYKRKYTHVKLNAGDMGYYLDEGAEDIEENRKKVIDLGYCEPGAVLHTLPGYREPIPYKNFRFEKWWVPLIPEAPYDPYYKDINIAGSSVEYTWNVFSVENAEVWNEEYVAHYEEDRYKIKFNAGGKFNLTVGEASNIAFETGWFYDDADKYKFTDRLGETYLGVDGNSRRYIRALKGQNLQEALDEWGFEPPSAEDREFLGWQQGAHPDRVNNKLIDFNPVDFSTITVEGPMEFTAVWKKKPLKLTFKEGPNMYYESGRKEFTLLLPARDVKQGPYAIADEYEGNLYELKNAIEGEQGYEDPVIVDDNGERNDYDYEFERWETGDEFVRDKIVFFTRWHPQTYDDIDRSVAWQADKQRYKGLEYVYGFGNHYQEEPHEMLPVIKRIAMRVKMFSPFPVFPLNTYKVQREIGSGLTIGEVDEYVNADFSVAENQGLHFAGWYQADYEKAEHDTFFGLGDSIVDDLEDWFKNGRPTVVGFSEPGLDTWFKYTQFTKSDDLQWGLGQYLKKIDKDFVINRKTGKIASKYCNSKIEEEVGIESIDIIALFTANLTLDAGEGQFADGSKEKVIENILVDTITPIKEYVGAGYEVPTPSDASKVFAGWKLVDAEGKEVRRFNDYETIDKDTRLVASYVDATGTIELTIKPHGAETIEVTKDDEGNEIYNVVEMDDVVLMLPQGTRFGDIGNDLPKFKRDGYHYYKVVTLTDAWYYNYEDGEYSGVVNEDDTLSTNTTIHLKWTKKKYSYNFFYEIDGKEEMYAFFTGAYGDKIKDSIYFIGEFKNMFDLSLENQPVKGYKITSINMGSKTGKIVTPETEFEGNASCYLTVEPLDTVITFDANGGELIGDTKVTVPYASYYKDIKNIVPKASYSEFAFVGWIDDKGKPVTDEYRVAISYDVSDIKQAKFTAQWTDKKYTLSFDAGEGKFKDGSNIKTFENVPYMQLLSNIIDGEKVYEEPTVDGKVFKGWEVMLKKQFTKTYTKENVFGEGIEDIDQEAEFGFELKAIYEDKTITFHVYLSDPSQFGSSITMVKDPDIKERTLPQDYTLKPELYFLRVGSVIHETVKEKDAMTFAKWFDYIYDKGLRYKADYGYQICGWKYEVPASKEAPRAKTIDMKDVDMNAVIKDGDIFAPLMAKGSYTVKIDANGGTYSSVADRVTGSGVKIHQENNTLMIYENVQAGTAADKISGMVMPRRSGYTLVGYSRRNDVSEKSLASNVFIAGDEYIYAVWSKNGNQNVRPTVNTRDNPGGGSSGTGGTAPTQNTSAPRVGTVEGVGPQAAAAADAPKQFTQTSVSAEMQQQSQAQVTQMVAEAGISADAANSSQVQEAVAEVQAGMNIAEQYAQIVSQINANPTMTTETTRISGSIYAKEAYWHTDANGNVTLETHISSLLRQSIKDVWQPVTNEQGQTGWYKFDANGYMQTGLVQDGNCTYYLSEERGAGYGQMVCNQTITIGGLTMTFNASGALVDMQYSAEASVKTIQDAATAAQQGQAVYLENKVEANSMV